MKKIKVLQIAFNDLGHGGIQSLIMTITKKLSCEIDEDVIVFSSKPAYYDEEFKKYGRIFKCPNYERNNWLRKKLDYYIRYFKIKNDVLRILKKYGPYDVVHSHTFFEAAPCMAAAKKMGIPVRIAHSHNTAMKDKRTFILRQINKLYQAVYRYIILKNSTDRIGCSQAAADYLFGKGNGKSIPNCVNYKIFQKNNFSQKDWNELRLIHIGNFLPQKNQLFLIEIFYELLKIKKDSSLIMVGRPSEYLEKVYIRIKELGIGDKVKILPHDSYVPKELSKADYFVFPSSFEGFGNVMLEAQAAGLHCFASTEVTTEVNCGLVTFLPLEKGAKEWAKIILKFYEKEGTEKKEVDMSKFSEEVFVQKFLDLYKKSVKK